MIQLNRNNYEMIMFDLLEGNIKEPERSALLEQIKADTFYAVEWENWQKTILPADTSEIFENKESLKKKSGGLIILPYLRYAAAACIVLGVAFGIYRYNSRVKTPDTIVADSGDKGKKPVKETPKISVDTNSSLRGEIMRMATEKRPRKEHAPGPEIKNQEFREPDRDEQKPPVIVVEEQQQQRTPQIQIPEEKKDNTPAITPKPPVTAIAASNMKVTITEENNTQQPNKNQSPIAVLAEKRKQLAGLFKKPKVAVEKTTETKTGYRLVIQNEDYRLIAGY